MEIPDFTQIQLLALDFDGVICDSVEEAWQSSLACARAEGLPAAPGSAADRERFRQLRPLIAEGADFLIIQEVLGLPPSAAGDIVEFRQRKARLAAEDYVRLRDLLASFRRGRMRADFPDWVRLHALYPAVRELLIRLQGDSRLLIVSTKQADIIAAILDHFAVRIAPGQVCYSGAERKVDLIRSHADRRRIPSDSVLFVDDQPDHFRGDRRGLVCRLADWGYLPPDRDPEEDPPLITQEELLSISRSWI